MNAKQFPLYFVPEKNHSGLDKILGWKIFEDNYIIYFIDQKKGNVVSSFDGKATKERIDFAIKNNKIRPISKEEAALRFGEI
jgi:hypothetical protein